MTKVRETDIHAERTERRTGLKCICIGTKIANFPGNHLQINMYIQDFSILMIDEVDSKGDVIKAASITVQSC